MKATNSLTQKPKGFTETINMPSVRQMINNTIADPTRAARFVSTLISAVNASEQLSNCAPNSIISAALRGEGMGLSMALQQFSIVPYGSTANFQLSYKGLAQLATRSGQYKDFGVFDVREGEYQGKDMRTRQPIIAWLEDDEREKLSLAGFYGFYELTNGFFKSIYWTHEKILLHADRYSKAFSKDKYEQLINGKLKEDEAKKLRSGSPWYDDPLSESHMKMCKKTVLMQMLGDGTAPLSLDMQTAIKTEQAQEMDDVIYADDPVVVEANKEREQKSVKTKADKDGQVTIDMETGEIIEEAE